GEILAAHATHDRADRTQVAQQAGDVALELLELALLLVGLEAERASEVVITVDRRELAALAPEECLLDGRVPLDRVEDADGALGLHEPIGKLADGAPISFEAVPCQVLALRGCS